ncbi:hypothetical protein AB0J82_10380 [Asanoa sp. NPDC049518]|uniref:hypothetical protein n=1 Tax=unclassified Asanoa TaxID=2685164 RepID=UPI0034436009
MAELLLAGGTVADGRGGPPVAADVTVEDGRIAAVGAPGTLNGRRTLDVSGKVVSAGFVDIHSHADFTLAVDGRAQTGRRCRIWAKVFVALTNAYRGEHRERYVHLRRLFQP